VSFKQKLKDRIEKLIEKYAENDLTAKEAIPLYNEIVKLSKCAALLSLAEKSLGEGKLAALAASKLISTLGFDVAVSQLEIQDLKSLEHFSPTFLQSYVNKQKLTTPISIDITYDELDRLLSTQAITHEHAADILKFIETRERNGFQMNSKEQLAQIYITEEPPYMSEKSVDPSLPS
jgi:hypothetical protein